MELKKMKKGEKNVISKLPIDIFFDILLRLPIKTISQWRRLSKTWYDLVLNPRFATIHYAKAPQNHTIYAVIHDWNNTFYLIDHECFDNRNVSAVSLQCQTSRICRKFYCYEVVGCVNGLVCFVS
ncbi:hypothetical protein AQUCO_01100075v1 [Aquilegia coerulea]|uniref:F-box domain-containing protein n=1 Tax=Aquilegia coerulea TaxID=218851 RepID=A0A2G5E5I3_AQUCA|nr:hypothetical protein AQUCO_01100075v1 [Aquilegia coerulea]